MNNLNSISHTHKQSKTKISNFIYLTTLLYIIIVISSQSIPNYQIGSIYIRAVDIGGVIFVTLFIYKTNLIKIDENILYIIYVLSIYTIYSLIMASLSPFDIASGVIQAVELLQVMVVLVILSQVFATINESKIGQVLKVIYLLCIFTASIRILDMLFHPYIDIHLIKMIGTERIFAFGVFYSIFQYYSTKNRFHIYVFILVLITVLFGGRRSEMIFIPISICIVLLVYWIYKRESINLKHKYEILTFSVLALTIGYLINLPGISRIIWMLNQGFSVFEGRILRWGVGIEGLRYFPFGAGLGNYSSLIQYVSSINTDMFFGDSLLEAGVVSARLEEWAVSGVGGHSTFFKMLIEGGLVGLLAFTVFWIIILRIAVQAEDNKLTMIITTMLVYLFFNSIFNEGWLYSQGRGVILIVFLALLVGLVNKTSSR